MVIGGGVGGCSILYWLARLGWDDVVLVERADLTSRLDVPLGRARRPAARLALADEDDDGEVDLYRTLGDEVGLETGWHEVGSLRLASSAERMEEIARQAGWAKTFGLPLELISAGGGAGSSSRRCRPTACSAPRTCRPTATSTRRQLTFALAEGARRGGAEIATNTRVTGDPVERGRVDGRRHRQGRDRDGRRRQRRRDVRARRSARSPA